MSQSSLTVNDSGATVLTIDKNPGENRNKDVEKNDAWDLRRVDSCK